MVQPSHPVRRVGILDYDALVRLWNACGLTHRPLGRDSREGMAVQLQQREICFLGMFDGERMIGSIIGSSDGRKGWINRLAVDPDFRGRGLGLRLIEACEQALHELGIQVIGALIEHDNDPSIATFRKAGYTAWDNIVYFSKRSSWDD